ncbi:MAG: NAD(P)/FAD-dependent oxidoreductase [Pseudomonadota bacterium]
MERVDVIVIGAGVVGLAIGRALVRDGREVIVLEKNDTFGAETSSRNSEVVHAGIYYRPGGMRARLAVEGRDALYAYCGQAGVPFLNCGKLIVAGDESERANFGPLVEIAEKNGVGDLRIIDADEARALEPGLRCAGAILSPSSGIIDSHALMLALIADIEAGGGHVVMSSPMQAGDLSDDDVTLELGGSEPMTVGAKLVINAAGLSSERVARSIAGLPGETIPILKFAKGQYFSYAGTAPFTRLIYPMPAPDSVGIHYTRDMGGRAKLGPDITFVDEGTGYDVDRARRDVFARSARRYWPALDPERLTPDYAGVRPKIAGSGEEGDFLIQGAHIHGARAYIGLYGIESPGLTTCLAIANYVSMLARDQSQ